ncbi:MAG: PHA/PHB synthase family protein [Methylovirgula sp.]
MPDVPAIATDHAPVQTALNPAKPSEYPFGQTDGSRAIQALRLSAICPDGPNDQVFDTLDRAGESVDHAFHAMLAKFTGGLSPMAMYDAFADWGGHLALSPGKQMQLAGKAMRKWMRFAELATAAFPGMLGGHCIEPLPQDKRFAAPEWDAWPFSLMWQGFLLQQQWWHNATTGVGGVTHQHENAVEFTMRQILDMVSPSNFIATNPVVQRRIVETGGANLVQGAMNFADDLQRQMQSLKPAGAEAFQVGRNIAVTKGKVVYRNRLIELIQYEPQTETVHAEPILFVPAWIMKYYILDLSPENSLVRYLVEHGYTVFMISWHNPGAADGDLDLEDYRRLGIMAALDAIEAIVPNRKVHAAGYCLGGTLLAIAAAAMARDRDDRLQSLTFFAAQTDFTEAGELTLFINESQVTFLEEMMRSQGYLDAAQMAATFQLLRSNDLIWSKMIHDYLMGERDRMTDLMAWNADATRMPARMHSEYLHHLFLDNDLAEGRYLADAAPVALSDIRAPIFCVGTERDHVAPWHSTFKIHLLTDTEVTYLLASGGHNVGIVSPPGPDNGHYHRDYRVHTKTASDMYTDPERWYAKVAPKSGSWWPEWLAWLDAHSSGQDGKYEAAREAGSAAEGYPPLEDAPGTYVLAG